MPSSQVTLMWKFCRFCGFTLLLVFLNLNPKVWADSSKIERLIDLGEYPKVISLLKETRWTISSDPRMLMNYCQAILALDLSKTDCIIDETIKPPIRDFLLGISALSRSDRREADQVFQRLLEDDESKFLGFFGLLESAFVGSDYAGLEKRLGLIDVNEETLPLGVRKEHLYFRLLLYIETARMDDASEILKKYPDTAFIDDPNLFEQKFKYLWATSQVVSIGTLLHKANRTLGRGLAYAIAQADYAWLTMGSSKQNAILRRAIAQNPRRAEIAPNLAYSLLGGNTSERKEGRELIVNAIKKHAHDMHFILSIAISLSSFQEREAAELAYAILREKKEMASMYSSHYTLSAWDEVYRGRLDVAEEHIKEALTRSPFDQGANWLAYLVAKKRQNLDDTYVALKRLYSLDPFNHNVVEELLRISEVQARVRSDQVFAQIRLNAKWYPAKLRKQIEGAH